MLGPVHLGRLSRTRRIKARREVEGEASLSKSASYTMELIHHIIKVCTH
jgi:hypothetical protein